MTWVPAAKCDVVTAAGQVTDCPRALWLRTLAHLVQVVPFSPASGLLEWCEDTTPVGEYLLGGGRRTGGAHGRYHQPGQLTFSDAMAQYNRDLAKDAPSDPAKRCAMVY